jgi:peptide/nickel transport system substrate-binding protein
MVAGTTVFAAGGNEGQAAGGQPVTAYTLPRNETLYYNGLQWGAIRGNNPYMAVPNNALAISDQRQTVFETLFAWNLLDGKLNPQLGTSYSWSGQTLTVQLNPNARWADGTALTAEDVAYSFNLSKTYSVGNSQYWQYLDSVTAQGNSTVIFRAKAPPAFNPKQIERALGAYWITQKAYWERKIASGDLGKGEGDLGAFQAWDIQGSGPYVPYFSDETKVVIMRNDRYWGAHRSLRGKLPVPKYIAHNIYRDNAAGDAALRRGEVDVSQQFTAQIWTYFPSGVETYLPQAPYYLPGYIPSIFFNVSRPGLNEAAVRKAIAMVIDYDQIGVNAMSGYTAPRQHNIMLPVPAEQALIDADALKSYQWSGIDVAGANRILDQAGWVRGTDGVRAKGGVRLNFRIECPYGWSDWNASLEIVAQSARQIGITITTYFPEQAVWNTDMQTGNFDIIMNNTSSPSAASPWVRAYGLMSSTYLPTTAGIPNTIGNWGRWQNAEANQIIEQITSETDAAKLKQLWTRLNVIYLEEMPFAGLMYRPWQFHQVSTNVWTGFPKPGDGVPPTILMDGYGIVGLYNIKLK